MSTAVEVTDSRYVEVRNSYFHEAYDYGEGGRGYGVGIGSRSIHCKVENNIFRKFRHSMIVADGSNYNVFGYNYSREQTDELNNIIGDLNLHGYQPYGNLFEGNMVDRIDADPYWGANGPLNTFFRNYTYYNTLRIEDMTHASIIGNQNASSVILNDSQTTFEFDNYAYKVYENSMLNEVYNYLPEKSYYLDEMPFFFNSFTNEEVSWPATGPPSLIGDNLIHNIPARIRWNRILTSNNLRASIFINNEENKDQILIFPNPTRNGRIGFEINSKYGKCNIKIYSLGGQLIIDENELPISRNNYVSIDSSDLEIGIYLMSVNVGEERFTKKIIIRSE